MRRDEQNGQRGQPATEELSDALDRLAELDDAALALEWAVAKGAPPPPALPPRLIRLALAHDLQASALGGLSPAMTRRLDRLAGEAGKRRAAKVA